MQTVDNDLVLSGGGEYSIKIGVTFPTEEEKQKESIVWTFVPQLNTGRTKNLQVQSVLHKKYWTEVDVDMTQATADDGSEIKYYGSYSEGPFCTSKIPNTVTTVLTETFGETLAQNTLNREDTSQLTDPELREIPSEHICIIPEFTLRLTGEYTEELSRTDTRVTEDDFTETIQNANTGEILHTSHPLQHTVEWWLIPHPDTTGLTIEKCYREVRSGSSPEASCFYDRTCSHRL